MKQLLFFLIVLFTAQFSYAGPLCALAPAGHNTGADQYPSPFANQQMSAVNNFLCSKFGCPPYLLLKNDTLQNAMASANQAGYQIRYSSSFMNQTVQSFGNYATIGILAHELGHIIDFAQQPQQIPQAQREATADRYAGCAFALAGHPESDLQGLANSLHAIGPSPGYPTPAQRVQLVRSGYHECK